MGNLLKLILVTFLGSLITFSGVIAVIYWLGTPFSFSSILAFVYAYFILLKPITKHWAGFLVYIAEYKAIRAEVERRRQAYEQFQEELNKLEGNSDQTPNEENK